jgi:hypothetical protein
MHETKPPWLVVADFLVGVRHRRWDRVEQSEKVEQKSESSDQRCHDYSLTESCADSSRPTIFYKVSASACPLCVASASSPLPSSPFALLSSLSSHLPANLKLLEREVVYPRDTATISLQVSMWWPRAAVPSQRQPRKPRSSGSTG